LVVTRVSVPPDVLGLTLYGSIPGFNDFVLLVVVDVSVNSEEYAYVVMYYVISKSKAEYGHP